MSYAYASPAADAARPAKPAGVFRRLLRSGLAALTLGLTAFTAPALAQPAIWSVKDADSTIYLLGTVHLLKPETQWKTPKLEAALNEAQELWMELPTTDPQAMQGEMMPLISTYGIGKTPLSKDLTADELKLLDEAARAGGLTGAQIDIFNPWLAALTISTASITKAGFDPASGVDGKIEAAFKARGIKPNGFETAKDQILVFASLTREDQLAYLRETLTEYQNAPKELDALVDQWAKADIAGMKTVFVDEMKTASPVVYDAILTKRNANWTNRIETLLKGKGVTFIAVGAAHLVGDDSVIAMLKAKGIEATRYQ